MSEGEEFLWFTYQVQTDPDFLALLLVSFHIYVRVRAIRAKRAVKRQGWY